MTSEPFRKTQPGGWYLHPNEIGISGFSGSGKTTLAEKLIAWYAGRGLSTGYFKNDAHAFQMDTPGKDTHRAWEAGAGGVCVQDPRHYALISRKDERGPDVAVLSAMARHHDLFLVEGRKYSPLQKIILLDERKEMDGLLAEALEGSSGRDDVLDPASVLALAGPADQAPRAERFCAAREIPYLDYNDVQAIAACIDGALKARCPRVRALLLGGGMSSRMGVSKNSLQYHGSRSQLLHLAEMMDELGLETSISVADESQLPDDLLRLSNADPGRWEVLTDRYSGLGPLSGILTAMAAHPAEALLVLGCDMPLLEADDLRMLLEMRNPLKEASAWASPMEEGLVEPLLCVYEPSIRGRLLSLHALGYRCPMGMLTASRVEVVKGRPEAAYNANDREEYRRALALLGRKVPEDKDE